MILAGSAVYSIFPDSALDYLEADMGIQGEREIAFPVLLDRIQRGVAPGGTPGLYLRGDECDVGRNSICSSCQDD